MGHDRSFGDVGSMSGLAESGQHALAQARGDPGIVASRANAGGAHAVQWSLPG